MKILHITTFTAGGAGLACLRLHSALLQRGIESKVLVLENTAIDAKGVYLYDDLLKKSAFRRLSDRANKSFQWRYQNLIMQGRAKNYDSFSLPMIYNNVIQLKLFQEADVINLHWVANFLNYKELPAFEKKIVWTLHDMNPFTGGCHYSYDCSQYTDVCLKCPQLKGANNEHIVESAYWLKDKTYKYIDIQFVAPSNWILHKFRTSRIGNQHHSSLIRNGINTSTFSPTSKPLARQALGLPQDKKIVLYVSDIIERERKGFHLLEKIISNCRKENSESANVCFCSMGKTMEYSQSGIRHLGYMNNQEQIRLAYSAADVFIIPSLEDNFPNTVLESMACGTPVVGFDTGGIPEMIGNGFAGYVVDKFDLESISKHINVLLQNESLRITMGANARNGVVDKFSDTIQADEYIALYNKLLSGGKKMTYNSLNVIKTNS